MSAYRPYPKYKPSGSEWLGDIPCDWDALPCRAFVDEQNRKNEGAANQNYLSLMANVGIILYADKGDVGNKKPEDLSKCKLVSKGDFVINSMNYGIGSYGLSEYEGVCSPVYIVLRPRLDVIESRFAHRIFENRTFQSYAQSFGNGILDHRAAINWDILKGIPAGIPSMAEQHAILSFLDRECGKLDALQAKQERLIELLKEKRQALISHAVTRGLDPTAKLKPSGIEWVGEVPEHWVVTALKRLIRQSTSGPYGSSLTKAMYTTEGFRVYGQQQVIPDDFTKGDYFISSKQYSEMQRYRVKPGDLLVSVMGTVGAAAIVPEKVEPGIINPRLVLYRFREALVFPRYLQTVIRSTSGQAQLLSASNGTTMDGLNMEIIGALAFPLPPLAEQRAIVAHLDEKCGKIDQLKAKAERGIELLKERRSALISAAVTGKIDVREV